MDWLVGIDSWVIYLVVGLLALGESAAFLGLVLPGEVALLAAGAVASLGSVPLWPLMVVALVGAVIGGIAGYLIGVRWGSAVIEWQPVRRRLASATPAVMEHLRKRGSLVVILSRFNSVTRALVPALAGTAGMPLRRFTAATALGGALWAGAFVAAGYLAGSSWQRLSAGSTVVSLVALALVVAVVVVAVRRHRRQSRADSTPELVDSNR